MGRKARGEYLLPPAGADSRSETEGRVYRHGPPQSLRDSPPSAERGGSLLHGAGFQEGAELGFVKHGDAEFLGLGGLGAGIFADDDPIGFLADGS